MNSILLWTVGVQVAGLVFYAGVHITIQRSHGARLDKVEVLTEQHESDSNFLFAKLEMTRPRIAGR